MSEVNKNSYNQITEEFSSSRESSPIDAEVVKFCNLLKVDRKN